MKAHVAFVVLAIVVAAAPVAAQVKPTSSQAVVKRPGQDPLIVIDGVVQPSPRKSGGPGQDPFAGVFFPPELVMQNQQLLGLSAEQRTAIVNEMVRSQQRFVELQWQMQSASEALRDVMQGSRMDEQRVMQQLDRVLETERQIKRTQIELQVRILNTLTEQQQQQLRQRTPNGKFSPERYDLGNVNYDLARDRR